MRSLKSLLVLLTLTIMGTKAQNITCTRELVHAYTVKQFNTNLQQYVLLAKTRKSLIQVCCNGYREKMRRRNGPVCDPVCIQNCGEHGKCITPSICKCDLGYEQSDQGICEIGRKHDSKSLLTTTVSHDDQLLKSSVGLEVLTQRIAARVDLTEVSKQSLQTTTSLKSFSPSIHSNNEEEKFDMLATTETQEAFFNKTDVDSRTSTAIHCTSCLQGTCFSGQCSCSTSNQEYRKGICQPCPEGSDCLCISGYDFELESRNCELLCNGRIHGCITGTCADYNQCMCHNGTIVKNGDITLCDLEESWKQSDLIIGTVLVVTVLLGVGVVFIIIKVIKLQNTTKGKGLTVRRRTCPEVRYMSSNNECLLTKTFQHCYTGETLP